MTEVFYMLFIWFFFVGEIRSLGVWWQCVFVSWFHLNSSELTYLLASMRAFVCVWVFPFNPVISLCCSLIVCFLNNWIDFVCFSSLFWFFSLLLLLLLYCVLFFWHAHAPANALYLLRMGEWKRNISIQTQFKDISYGNWHHTHRRKKKDFQQENEHIIQQKKW